MRQQGQPAIIAGVVLLVAGGVLLAVGWDRAAELGYVQGQFPYLLSASLPGLALIIIATTVLVLATVRRDAAEREAQLEKLTASVNDLASMIGPRDPFDPKITGEYRPRPRLSGNGAGSAEETAQIAPRTDFEQGR